MPQMSPIAWNTTSTISYLSMIIIMTNLIYPINKKNSQKKKKSSMNKLMLW